MDHLVCNYDGFSEITYNENMRYFNAFNRYDAHQAVYSSAKLLKVDNYDTLGTGTLALKSTNYMYYDGANNLIKDSLYSYVTSHADLVHYIAYDGSNRLVTDSMYSFATSGTTYASLGPVNKISNHYSTNLDSNFTYYWTGTGWVAYYSLWHTYNSLNLQTTFRQITDLGSRSLITDSIAYSGSIPTYKFTAFYGWNTTTLAWNGSKANSYHYNSAGNWDTCFYYNWQSSSGSFIPTEKDYFFYNSYGLIDSSVSKLYNIATSTYADTTYDKGIYYYEMYDDAIIAISSPDATISTYPNPAQQMLNIDYGSTAIGSTIAIKIDDICGRNIFSKTVTLQTQKQQIDLANFATGLYIISLFDGNGRRMYQDKLIKD